MPFRKSYRRRTARRPRLRRSKASYRSKRPARFSGSRLPRRYKKNVRRSRALNTIAETELIGARHEALAPVQFTGNTDMYQLSFNLGHQNLVSQTELPLNMFNVPVRPSVTFNALGVAVAGAPDKNYRFLKNNTSLFQVIMDNPQADNYAVNQLTIAPIKFTFLVLKPRMKNLNDAPNPSSDLWINERGKTIGYATGNDLSSLDVQTYLLNKKKYVVLKRQHFTLAPPLIQLEGLVTVPGATDQLSGGTSSNMNFPATKTLRLDTRIMKKTFYGDTAGTSQAPKDFADNIFVVCLATTAQGFRASNWTMDMHTTTSYTDL